MGLRNEKIFQCRGMKKGMRKFLYIENVCVGGAGMFESMYRNEV